MKPDVCNTCQYLPPANEVWGKVICLQACVCPQRGMPASGGVPGPGGPALEGVGGAWSGGAWSGAWSGGAWSGGPGLGVPGLGGLVWGECLLQGQGRGYWWRPLSGRLLLRAVRIPLECILVLIEDYINLHTNQRCFVTIKLLIATDNEFVAHFMFALFSTQMVLIVVIQSIKVARNDWCFV